MIYKLHKKGLNVFSFFSQWQRQKSIRNAIITKQNNSKGYKAFPKDLDIPLSVIGNVIKKFHGHKTVKTLSGCGAKKKLNKRSLQRSMLIVEKAPHKTSIEFQTDLDQSGVVISAYTIQRTLNLIGLQGPRPTAPLLKEWHKKATLMFTKNFPR